MAGTHWLTRVLPLLSAAVAFMPLSAIGESACGVDGARVLLDFDVMHPSSKVLHLGTRLDIRVIGHGLIGLDVRDRQTGKSIFDEVPHGPSLYEVAPGSVLHEQENEKVRVLETWIYAVILYIDYRGR
jgi:hypothetical protein